MIFKLVLLLAALKLHDVMDKPLQPAMLYTLPLFFLGLFYAGSFVHLLFFSVLTGVLSFLYFWLLSWFNEGPKYYAIMAIGGVILLAAI